MRQECESLLHITTEDHAVAAISRKLIYAFWIENGAMVVIQWGVDHAGPRADTVESTSVLASILTSYHHQIKPPGRAEGCLERQPT